MCPVSGYSGTKLGLLPALCMNANSEYMDIVLLPKVTLDRWVVSVGDNQG